VYLFGQMGVRAHSLWLTDGIRRAFESSSELWVENPDFPPPPTGAAAAREPATGPALSEVATAQDLKRLHTLLSTAGLSPDAFDALPLSAAYPAVSDVSDRVFGVDYTVMPERVLKSRAKAAGKPVHSEWASLEEITRFMTDLPDDLQRRLQLQLLRKTLDEGANVKAAELRLNQWLAGDMEGWDAFAAHVARSYPEVNSRIGAERNKAWLPRIDDMLTRTPAAFVCVGVLHLSGADSIQIQLKRSGLTVLRA
jgi:uncharacterized protein YbaP (TraB family)